jgi:SDR family mycofactocin-dependent oxidoreductase
MMCMGTFDGRVAFITGGARGQGRCHAINLAREGADVVLFDICNQVDSVEYPMATGADLAETAKLVQQEGRRALPIQGDVRRWTDVESAVAEAAAEFGRLDLVVANAGILASLGERAKAMTAWQDSIDTMLSGVFYTLQASSRAMLEAGHGGSIVITSSTAGLRGFAYKVELLTPGQVGYTAAKHGVLGIMKNFALALGPHGIRVNAVHPMGVRTPMVVHELAAELVGNAPPGWMSNVMNVDLIEPQDVSEAVLWLLSDAARYVTGISMSVDAGLQLK